MRFELEGIRFTIPNRLIDAVTEGKITDVEIINAINTLVSKTKAIENKRNNPEKAREAKTSKTKEKIQNAINLLRLQNKPINAYQVSNLSGVAYNTARKYLKKQN